MIIVGVVGPYLIGALKARFGGYTVPMIFMTCVNSLAVVYFATLLPFLPAKTASAQQSGDSCESAFQLALFWCHSWSRLQLAGAAYPGLAFTLRSRG